MNKNVVAICVTAIVISVIGVAGWVVATGTDADRILGWAGTTIGPLIAGLAAYIRVARVADDVNTVKQRTNGILDELFTRVRKLEGPNPPMPGAAPTVTRASESGEGPPSDFAPG